MSKHLNVKRLTVYLSTEVDRRLRRRAQQEDRPISTIAEYAFLAYLEQPKGGVPRRSMTRAMSRSQSDSMQQANDRHLNQ